MKKLILKTIAVIFMATSVALILPETSFAATPIESACQGAGGNCGLTGGPTVPEVVKTVSNILLYLITIIGVIMIIISAIRYATSGGEQAAIAAAKNTIVYSIVGIIIAFLAFAIVNFVVDNLT